MPDASMKKLLVKIGINSQDWKKIVAEIKQDLKQVEQQAKTHAKQQEELSKQDMAKQKEKQKLAAEEVQWIEKKIRAIQKTLDVQELDAQQVKKKISDAKNLISLQEATLNLLSKEKEYKDVDLSKLRERIALRKSELSVQEAQLRVSAGATGVSVPPGAGEMGAARMAQLQTNLKRASASTAMTGIKLEMAAQEEAYRQGNIQTAAYVEKQGALQQKLHVQRMEVITQEELAQKALIDFQIKTGKMTADEAKIQTNVVAEQIKKQQALEEAAYRKEVERLKLVGARPGQAKEARMSGIQRDVAAINRQTIEQNIKTEMQLTRQEYAQGEMNQKAYLEKERMLLGELHRVRVESITAEMELRKAEFQKMAALGKMDADEAIANINKVEAKLKQLLQQEESTFKVQAGGLKTPSFMERIKQGMERSEGGRSSMLGGILGATASIGMGGGILGTTGGVLGGLLGPEGALAGSVLGMGLQRAIDSLIEKFDMLGEHIEEATGKETQLRVEFEKLTRGQGAAPEEFLNNLRTVSHGLADNAQLYQIANNFMRLGMKMTTDQIVDLTRVTVDLSRASGKTAEEGIQALINASRTGYMRTLAFTTGISVQAMRLRGLSGTLSPIAREQLQMAEYMKLANAQMAQMGPLMLTLPEVIKIYRTQQAELIHDFASAMGSSKGFGLAMSALGKTIMEVKGDITPLLETLGKDFGQSLYLIVPTLHAFETYVRAIWGSVKLWWDVMSRINPALMLLRSILGGPEFKNFGQMIGLMALAMDEWTMRTNIQILRMQELLEVGKAVTHLDFSKIEKIKVEFDKKKAQEVLDFQQRARDDLSFSQTSEDKAKMPGITDDTEVQKQLDRLREQIAIAAAKNRLQIFEQELDKEKEDLKQAYEEGLLTLASYIEQQRRLNTESHQAKLQEIAVEKQAQAEQIQSTAEDSKEDYRVTQKKLELLNTQTQLKIQEENLKFQRENEQLDNQELQDKVQARRAYVAAVLNLETQGVQERMKLLQDEFNENAISADDYISKRRALIQEELQLKLQQYAEEEKAAEKNEKALADIRIKEVAAEQDAAKQIAELEQQADDLRLKALTSNYEQRKKFLEGGIQLGATQAGVGIASGTGTQLAGMEQLKELTDQYMRDLIKQETDLIQDQEVGTKQWFEVVSAIQQAQQEQIKLNQEIAKMKDYLTPIGDLFQQIAAQMGSLTSVEAKNWKATFEGVAKQLEQIGKLQQQQAAAGGLSLGRGVWEGFKQLIHRGRGTPTSTAQLSPMDLFKQQVSTSVPIVNNFTAALNRSVSAINGFIAGLGGQPTATTGGKVFGPPKSILNLPPGMPSNWAIEDNWKTGTSRDVLIDPTTGKSAPITGPGLPQSAPTGTAGMLNALLPTSAQASAGGVGIMTSMFSRVFGGLFGGSSQGTAAPSVPTAGTSGFADAVSSLPLKKSANLMNLFNQQLDQAAGNKNSGLQVFTQKLGNVVGALGGFANNVFGAKGTGSGILGGLLSGASTGMEFGGPIGAGIGAAVGGVMGGIVGSKQQAVTKNVEKLNYAFDQVIRSLNAGAIGIGDALKQTQDLRQQAVNELGGSKKGQKQLPAMLQAFDAEIYQLQAQIQKTVNDMKMSLAELAAGPAWSQITSQLASIMQKYEQFAQAAKNNTVEMAMALADLKLSLENYAETLNNDVRQANEQAIQDALDYNNLLMQRQNIINQEAQQEYEIMTQGVLTRQQNVAMTKMQQIANLRYNRDQQLDQINQELALTKYKLSVEGQIFNLATTRVGLEMQLLALKEQDYNNQIAVTIADQATIARIEQIVSSPRTLQLLGRTPPFGDMSALIGTFFGSTAFGTPGHMTTKMPATGFNPAIATGANFPTFPMNLVGGLLNTYMPGNVTGLSGLPGVSPIGNLAFNNTDLNRPSGIRTNPLYVAPGPGWDRLPGGGTRGYYPGSRRMTGYPEGGLVPETEMALVHKGETIFPPHVMSKFVSVINTATTRMATFINSIGTELAPKFLPTNLHLGGDVRVSTEQQIHSIATSRVAMETQLLQTRKEILNIEMGHLAMLQSLLNSSGRPDLENYMIDMYQKRGRYVAGGFYKEYL